MWFSMSRSIIAIAIALSVFSFMPYLRGEAILRGMVQLLVALAMIYAILGLGMEYQRKKCNFFSAFDGKIFTIFLLSWPTQAVIEVCLNKILKLSWFLVMPIMFVAGLLGPLLLVYLFEKMKVKNRFLRTTIGLTSGSFTNGQ